MLTKGINRKNKEYNINGQTHTGDANDKNTYRKTHTGANSTMLSLMALLPRYFSVSCIAETYNVSSSGNPRFVIVSLPNHRIASPLSSL